MSFNKLSDRMKAYEAVPKLYLMRRVPVIVRVDIRSGSQLVKGFKQPYDDIFRKTMIRTMEHVAKEIQGCIMAYTQSDEISFVLSDYKKLNSDAWFDYNVEKIVSLSASEATFAFNKYFAEEARKWFENLEVDANGNYKEEDKIILEAYTKAIERGAKFDSRCANYPKEEVANYIYWRQSDASRNSVSMAARAKFSHSQCDNKNSSQLQEMLFQECGINWNDYPTQYKRGVCWTHEKGIDYEMPMLKGEDRKYLENLVYYQEES
jgi:tRNA(His) 5'-end guanylyltransferase